MSKVIKDWDYKNSKLLDADIKKEFEKTGASMLELLTVQLIKEFKKLNNKIRTRL